MVLGGKQSEVLEHVAAFAARFDCLEAIYIFGSVARGDFSAASDIDLAVHYRADMGRSSDLTESYTQFQSQQEEWTHAASERFGMPVKFARLYATDRDDDTWFEILRAAEKPVARLGKAILAATERRAKKR